MTTFLEEVWYKSLTHKMKMGNTAAERSYFALFVCAWNILAYLSQTAGLYSRATLCTANRRKLQWTSFLPHVLKRFGIIVCSTAAHSPRIRNITMQSWRREILTARLSLLLISTLLSLERLTLRVCYLIFWMGNLTFCTDNSAY